MRAHKATYVLGRQPDSGTSRDSQLVAHLAWKTSCEAIESETAEREPSDALFASVAVRHAAVWLMEALPVASVFDDNEVLQYICRTVDKGSTARSSTP